MSRLLAPRAATVALLTEHGFLPVGIEQRGEISLETWVRAPLQGCPWVVVEVQASSDASTDTGRLPAYLNGLKATSSRLKHWAPLPGATEASVLVLAVRLGDAQAGERGTMTPSLLTYELQALHDMAIAFTLCPWFLLVDVD